MYAKAFSLKTGVNTATHSFSIFLMKETIIFYKRYLEWYEHFANYFQHYKYWIYFVTPATKPFTWILLAHLFSALNLMEIEIKSIFVA